MKKKPAKSSYFAVTAILFLVIRTSRLGKVFSSPFLFDRLRQLKETKPRDKWGLETRREPSLALAGKYY